MTLYSTFFGYGFTAHCPTCEYRETCPGMLTKPDQFRPDCHSKVQNFWTDIADRMDREADDPFTGEL